MMQAATVLLVFLLSMCVLGYRYSCVHVGALCCTVSGIGLVLLSDSQNRAGGHSLEGDIFGLFSSFCFGIFQVLMERLLTKGINVFIFYR